MLRPLYVPLFSRVVIYSLSRSFFLPCPLTLLELIVHVVFRDLGFTMSTYFHLKAQCNKPFILVKQSPIYVVLRIPLCCKMAPCLMTLIFIMTKIQTSRLLICL